MGVQCVMWLPGGCVIIYSFPQVKMRKLEITFIGTLQLLAHFYQNLSVLTEICVRFSI